MYEPIIDPMIFYWIDILEKVRELPCFILIIGMVGGPLIVMISAMGDATEEQIKRYLSRWVILTAVLLSISSLGSIFTPSKDTMYKMLVAKQVTPHNLQVTGETVEKIVEKIIEVTQEVKK